MASGLSEVTAMRRLVVEKKHELDELLQRLEHVSVSPAVVRHAAAHVSSAFRRGQAWRYTRLLVTFPRCRCVRCCGMQDRDTADLTAVLAAKLAATTNAQISAEMRAIHSAEKKVWQWFVAAAVCPFVARTVVVVVTIPSRSSTLI
jgi:hypothetical protein